MRLQDLGLPFAVSANGMASVVVPTNHKHYKQLTKLDDYNLTGSDGPPDLPTMRFTPKPKPKKDKFILFWVYGDDEDTPYIIRNVTARRTTSPCAVRPGRTLQEAANRASARAFHLGE